MATIGEMIVKLLADTSGFNASMDEAAAKVTASNDAMSASMASSMQAFTNFDNITKESVKSTEGLAEAQAALQAVQQTGAFTSEELAAKQALVDAAMAKVGQETQAASGALSMFTRNSRTMYSTSALITDAMTGQFSRMRREVAALGNETGLMAQAFQFALSPAGLIAAALAAIALDAYNATQRINELQHAVLAGGGASGLSGDQLESMAEGFKKMGFDIQSARDAEDALSASGRVTQSDMANATQASLAYAQITGEKIDTLAKKFANVGTEGATGFIKLDESMHFLTDSQRETIASLAKQGETAKAVSIGYDALAAHGMLALQQLQSEGKKTEGFWAGVGTVIQNVNDTAMKGMGFGLTKQDELDKTNKLLEYYKQIGVTGQKINDLLKQRADLMAQIAEQARTASSRGAGAQGGIQADEALLHGGLHEKGSGNVTAQLEAQLKQQEADQKVSYDQRQEFEVEYWGQILATAKKGSAEYTTAWQHTQDLQKQIDQQQLAASNRTASQRAEAERHAAQQNKQYNRDAYESMISEMRKAAEANAEEVRQSIQLAQEGAESAVESAKFEYDKAAENARAMVQLHQITQEQAVAVTQQAAQLEYEAELAALEKEKALVQQKPELVAKINAQIRQLEQQHDRQMNALANQAALAYQKTWEDRLKPISNAFDTAIRGMIQGTQTFKQAIGNMLENVAASFLEHSIDITVQWIADSMARTNATAAAAAQQVTITKAAASQTKAVDAQTGQSQIMSAAATGAAKAYQAIVGIPYVGPILAPVAAAVAFAGIEAFTADLSSAAGGWERVPADGMLTELHRNEMVLPAHVADPVRKMAQSGGGGGAVHLHVNAVDASTFRDFARRNPRELAMWASHAARRGYA